MYRLKKNEEKRKVKTNECILKKCLCVNVHAKINNNQSVLLFLTNKIQFSPIWGYVYSNLYFKVSSSSSSILFKYTRLGNASILKLG